MAARQSPAKRRPPLAQRTPLAEWIAAGIGLLLTLAVLAYSLVEGMTEGNGPPGLTVISEPAEAAPGGWVLPITVKNVNPATAAAVEVSGKLERGGQVIEERRATFAYVPGRGEARGGLVFEHNPAAHSLKVRAEGYEAP